MMELTVVIRAMTSPVAGQVVSTTGPEPDHCPSKTPSMGLDVSVGKSRALRTAEAREERGREEVRAMAILTMFLAMGNGVVGA